jgi:hypothetical protein
MSHIYLFEWNDMDSMLFDAIGLEDWLAITSIQIEKGVEDNMGWQHAPNSIALMLSYGGGKIRQNFM